MQNTVMILRMTYLFIAALLIKDVLCTEGNVVRDHRANLAPAAGGYGTSDMDDNYDYILDDTPPRGTLILCAHCVMGIYKKLL